VQRGMSEHVLPTSLRLIEGMNLGVISNMVVVARMLSEDAQYSPTEKGVHNPTSPTGGLHRRTMDAH
jgi:hypothetical protein